MPEDPRVSLADLVDATPDAMVVMDADGSISLVNVQSERLFGYSRIELLGQPLDVLIPQRFRDRHAAHIASYLVSPKVRPMGEALEVGGRHKDGSEIPV